MAREIVLKFTNSEVKEIERILRKKYQSPDASLEVLCKKVILREYRSKREKEREYERPYNFAGGDRFTESDDGATY